MAALVRGVQAILLRTPLRLQTCRLPLVVMQQKYLSTKTVFPIHTCEPVFKSQVWHFHINSILSYFIDTSLIR